MENFNVLAINPYDIPPQTPELPKKNLRGGVGNKADPVEVRGAIERARMDSLAAERAVSKLQKSKKGLLLDLEYLIKQSERKDLSATTQEHIAQAIQYAKKEIDTVNGTLPKASWTVAEKNIEHIITNWNVVENKSKVFKESQVIPIPVLREKVPYSHEQATEDSEAHAKKLADRINAINGRMGELAQEIDGRNQAAKEEYAELGEEAEAVNAQHYEVKKALLSKPYEAAMARLKEEEVIKDSKERT